MQTPTYGPFPQPPICLALVLAGSVSVSEETGRCSIVDAYSSLSATEFPVEFLSMEAYVVLTACDGDVLVELQLEDVNQLRPTIFRQLISAYFDGPQDVQEVIFHHYNITIPMADEYRLLLTVYRPNFTHPEFIIGRRLPVTRLP